MVIGNRSGSKGKVKVSRALLSAFGEIVVGRSLDAVAAGQTITFLSNGTIKLHSPEAFEGVIAGFSPGNIIELDAQPTGTPIFVVGTLTFTINGLPAALKVSGSLSTTSFKITPLLGGGALISHT